MKVELHCHTSRYSGCATATPAELMERMVQTGYEAVFLTEHDAVWPEWELAQLRDGWPDLRVFGGVELSLPGDPMVHLLVLGTSDPAYLALRADPAAILDKARAEGHLTVLAHPFRWAGAAEMLEAGLLPDALEHLTGNHDAHRAGIAKTQAERLGLPIVNAGDTHGLDFLNRFWIETDRPLAKPDDIRAAVLNRAYANRSREA